MCEKTDLINTIFLGEVSNVHNYGAFIKIPGKPVQGMVHRSQLSKSSVDDASDVLQKGERVWCKVISVTDDGKIALSMKVVDQGSGKDLDPTGVQIHQDELKRKERPSQNRRKAIQLGAIFDTTCTKCGTKGHLSRDCFKTPDGKTYELIPEEDDDDQVVAPPPPPPSTAVKEKKRKKKKDKKCKDRDRDKDKSKKKKKKSKKKRKHSSSESSSESSDSSPERSSKKRKLEKSKSRK